MKGVRKLVKTIRLPRVVDSNVYSRFEDALHPYILAAVAQNAVEVWIQPVDKEWIKTLWFSPYYPKTIKSNKHDHVTPFLVSALILPDHRAHVFVSENEILYLNDMVWEAGSATQMSRPGTYEEENAVRQV